MSSFLKNKYRQIKDLPDQIPIFPLNGIILLPGSNLPLNIFEPRYLTMTEDVLGKDRLIGMIQPQSGNETKLTTDETIPIREIGCVGRITEFLEMDDGRMLVTLTGICRFKILKEVTSKHPYRHCQVNYQPFSQDLDTGIKEHQVNRENLLKVLKTYLEYNELDADWESIHQSSNEFLVNTLSMISPYGPEEKQALLETPDLKSRSEILIALAEMDLASNDDDQGTTIQ